MKTCRHFKYYAIITKCKSGEKMTEESKKNEIININQGQGEFLLYTSPDGEKKIQVRLIDETVWLTQAQMVELFQSSKANISEHISNIFKENELDENSVVRDFRTTAQDGKNYITKFYNLDVIISVGYRVKSIRGKQFRQWATQRIKEYLIKGFTINKEYLKNPEGKDYFDELLKEIREIRTSEKRFYLKVRDIYATSIDYDGHVKLTKEFFAMVQNKMLWAVSGKTAAEIIDSRASADKQNMGLTSWENNRIRTTDVTIAKNYLSSEELDKLERFVVMFLDYAELQAINRKEMRMSDWVKKLDAILSLNEMEILTHKGKISKELADKKAKLEYEKYDEKRKEQENIEAEEQFIKEVQEIKQLEDKKKK